MSEGELTFEMFEQLVELRIAVGGFENAEPINWFASRGCIETMTFIPRHTLSEAVDWVAKTSARRNRSLTSQIVITWQVHKKMLTAMYRQAQLTPQT